MHEVIEHRVAILMMDRQSNCEQHVGHQVNGHAGPEKPGLNGSTKRDLIAHTRTRQFVATKLI
jgi:hypothetical protein